MTDETLAIRQDDNTYMFAAACLLRQDKPDAAGPMTAGGVTADSAAELLRELGGYGIDRRRAEARAARTLADDEIAMPARWRQAWHAVELCRRAAEIAARR